MPQRSIRSAILPSKKLSHFDSGTPAHSRKSCLQPSVQVQKPAPIPPNQVKMPKPFPRCTAVGEAAPAQGV